MIDVKPIALFRMEGDKGIDDKVPCVPLSDLERKAVTVDGWYSREDAVKEIEAARERFWPDAG